LVDLQKLTFHDALKEYQKLKFVSSYGAFYGRKPALEDLTDGTILRSQKFSRLPWTQIINSRTKKYLDSWQEIEYEEYYKGLALSTLRSMNTYVQNHQPSTSTSRVSYKKFIKDELVKVERYDKLIEQVSINVRKKFALPKDDCFFDKRKIFVPSKVIIGKPKRATDSYGRLASRRISLKNQIGNGNITSQNAPRDLTIHSLYKDSYQGRLSPTQVSNYGNYFTISAGTGACIPDPKMMTQFQTKFKVFSNSMERMQNKMASTIGRFRDTPNRTGIVSQKEIKRNKFIQL
jgi:hypothetical protein